MPEVKPELELSTYDRRPTPKTGDSGSGELALQSTVQMLGGSSDRYVELESALIKAATSEAEAGNLAEAEALFRKALVIGERALGPEHPSILPALTGLGAARMLRGGIAEAESLLDRALAMSETRVGEDQPELVILLNDLARLCLKKSLHAFAEPPLMRLLAIKRSKGEDRPEVATVLASLAFVHQSLGRHMSAEQLWTRVLHIREQTLAPNHFSVATALEHLADSCAARGKRAQALELLQRAQAIREVTLGKDHSSLRISRERVADLQLQASEDYIDSEDVVSAPAPELGLLGSGEVRQERIIATHGWSASEPVERPQQSPPSLPEPKVPLADDVAVSDMPFYPETAFPQSAAEPAPYRDIILSLRAELDPADESPTLGHRAAALLVSAGAILRKRDRSVEIGVAAMTLVLIAFAGSRAWGKMGDPALEEVAADRAASVTPLVYAPDIDRLPVAAPSSNIETARNVASTATLSASRPSAPERTAAARPKTSAQRANQISSLPMAVNVNFDSVVRAVNAPGRDVGASILSQPATTQTVSSRPSFVTEEATPPQRAKLIGAMPVPRYPVRLAQVRGDVKIRFMVDSLGRPMMATFSVMASPDAQLTEAVRQVVPRMRFEPARTEGPAAKPTSEWVETVFKFER